MIRPVIVITLCLITQKEPDFKPKAYRERLLPIIIQAIGHIPCANPCTKEAPMSEKGIL